MTHNIAKLLIDWKTLKALGWPYSRAHTWRMMHEGRFPQCIKLGGGGRNAHPVWRWMDVRDYLAGYGLIVELAAAS